MYLGPKPWNDSNGTPFWKGIKHIDPIFACSVTHRIGNGNKTSFWHDNWQDGPLKFRFPTLYSETPDKNISVAQCTNADGWHLQPSTLSHAAQIEKDRLLSSLQQMDTPHSDVPDLIVWNRHPSTFSTSTAYKFISSNPRPSSHLKYIWEIKAPLRVQIFAWLMLSDRLTTIDNLSRRGWVLPNMCVMCRADTETNHHLFHTCSLATQICTYIRSALPLPNTLPYKFVTNDSAHMLTDPAEHITNRNWEITTCYVLWRERCRRIFSDELQSHISLVREIKREIHNWFQL